MMNCPRCRSVFGQRVRAIGSLILAACLGGVSQGQSLSAKQFDGLSEHEKPEILLKALEHRQAQLQNVMAKSVTRVRIEELTDGKLGKVCEDLGKHVCESRRVGASYRTTMSWWKNADQKRPTIRTIAGYDADTGTSRILVVR